KPARPIRATHRAFAGWLHLVESKPSSAGREVRRSVTDLEDAVIGPAATGDGGAQHADALTAERDERAGIGRVRAHLAHELLRRAREVELASARLELRSERDLFLILRPSDHLAGQVPRHLALEKLATELGETFLELTLRLVADLRSGLREDRPGIELRRSFHQRDSGLGIAGEDGVRDRCRTAPPRTKRR